MKLHLDIHIAKKGEKPEAPVSLWNTIKFTPGTISLNIIRLNSASNLFKRTTKLLLFIKVILIQISWTVHED